MKIINILSNHSHFDPFFIQDLSHLINQYVNLIRLALQGHFIYEVYPFPYSHWVLSIKVVSYELFRLILFTLPLEFLIVQAVLSSESRNTARSRHTCTCNNKNFLVFEHTVNNCLNRDFYRQVLINFSLYFSIWSLLYLNGFPIDKVSFYASEIMTLSNAFLKF